MELDDVSIPAYRVKVTVRNNKLLSAIEDAGYKNLATFARAAEIAPSSVSAITSLRKAPISSNGEFTIDAKKIMEVLGAAPSDLWTNEQLTLELKRSSGQKNIDLKIEQYLLDAHLSAMLLPNPETIAMDLDKSDVVESALSKLSNRKRRFIRDRFFNEKSINEIAKDLDVSFTRALQIERSALNSLRHPEISEKMREHYE